MATRISDTKRIYRHMPLTYDDWATLLDALEADASDEQRDRAQDTIQRRAPRSWLDAVEARDSR